LSVHFLPKLDKDGALELSIDGIWAGRLPLPDAVWNSQRAKLETLVRAKLPELRRQSHISDGGSANAGAVAVAMSDSLLHVLNGEPASPVIFLPMNPHGGYPVKLTELDVGKGSIAFSALPLTAAERGKLLERIEGK
jgi:hypothetical protein